MVVTSDLSEWHLDPARTPEAPSTASLLDTDLREICQPVMTTQSDWTSKSVLRLQQSVVLQVQKVRDAFSPKSVLTCSKRRLLRMTLSDGHVSINAIELNAKWRQITPSETPPGTKIRLKANRDIGVCSGFLVLDENNFELLGGRVESLVAKWEAAKEMAQFKRAVSVQYQEGYVPWVPFGKKIEEKAAKSHLNGQKKSSKEVKEENEREDSADPAFKSARAEAINEAKQSGAKVFGKAGEIKTASTNKPNSRPPKTKASRRERHKDEEIYATSKPSNVSLLDFLGGHLQDDSISGQEKEEPEDHHNVQRHEERQISFENNRGSRRGRGGRREHSGRGRGGQQHLRGHESGRDHQSGWGEDSGQRYGGVQRGRGHQSNRGTQGQDRRQQHRPARDNREQEPSRGPGRHGRQPQEQYVRRQNYESYKNDRQYQHQINAGPYQSYEPIQNQQYPQQQIRQQPQPHRRQNPAQHPFNNCPQPQTAANSANDGVRNGGARSKNESERGLNYSKPSVKEGEVCLAKYWKDGIYYPAEIKAIGLKSTAVVVFLDYGNCEEVFLSDLKPFS